MKKRFNVYCLPKDIYNPICKTCIRRRSHKDNEHLNKEIVSLGIFMPRWSDKTESWHCDQEVHEMEE